MILTAYIQCQYVPAKPDLLPSQTEAERVHLIFHTTVLTVMEMFVFPTAQMELHVTITYFRCSNKVY